MSGAGAASGGKFGLGSPAPEFTGTSLAGEAVSLSDFKGKVVLIDFWATWCGPCVQELPNVIEAYASYHDKGFEIVAISLDESQDDLDTFLKEHPGMTWVHLFDGKGWDSDIAVQYNVEAIPFTLLLDQDGNVVRQDLRGEALENALADLLGG